MTIRRREGLLHSAACGLEVWMWYAVMEYIFATAAPIMIHGEKVLDAARWRGTVILFACYMVFGIVMGLLAGLSMDSARDLPLVEYSRRVRKLSILLMVAAFGINLALVPGAPGKPAALLAVSLVTAALIWNTGKTDSNPGLPGYPAAVAGTLILTSRLALVTWRSLPAVLTVPLTLLAAFATLLAAVLAIRLATRVRASEIWSPAMEHSMIAAVTLAMVFGPNTVSAITTKIGTPNERAAATGKLRPNVILISMDTVRADHMGIYGYARQNTPNLKELLKASTLYTDFISASTITLTSHASIFTGLYPQTHGAYKQVPDYPMGRPLPAGIPTMASILQEAGYRNMSVAANLWYLGREWGLLRGFDYSWAPSPQPLVESNHAYLLRSRISELLHNQPVAGDFYSSPTVEGDMITSRATTLIDQFGSRQAPFFLFLNYMDAHWPYHSPAALDSTQPEWDDRFNGADEEEALRTRVDCEGEAVPSGYQTHAESQYDGAIAYIDQQIGELVQHLKQTGAFDRTLLIVTADHGEAFGDRSQLGHNVSVYQNQIHVPLIVKYPVKYPVNYPGAGQPNRVENLASHIDLLPTVLDVAGFAARPDLPGVSLLRLNSIPDRVIFSERHTAGGAGAGYGPCLSRNDRFPGVQYAVMQGTRKMISSSQGLKEAYDLESDPNEKKDLYRTDPPLDLESALVDWMRRTPRFHAAQQQAHGDQLKSLRSLGYLQ